MAIQIERWAKVQKRADGAGVRVYLSSIDLPQIFGGKVPPEIEYRLTDTDGKGTVTIKLRAQEIPT